ncbi:aminotransferase class V-fold PLP-dependent enzyme [Candidatus Curtissbacteria bacterium]|nr:aminotransferase class V-fold PLP-dependent enzyme [Candidatus Curtissbacteria bacterium]
MNIGKIKRDFPIFQKKINGKSLVYLDSAATSQKPKKVLDLVDDYYDQYNANVHRGIHTLSVEATEAYEAARARVAKFVGVSDPVEIIFTRNATEAINLVAYAWGRVNISSGDEIVTTIMEHHSNFVPWQQLALENGAVLKVVPIDENGELDIVAFEKALGPKTKLVTFTHVSNVLGTINDVKQLSKLVNLKSPKARIMIDGAMPPFLFGGEMISKVTLEKTTWNELPWKFEAGTPNVGGAIGLAAACDYLDELGMENVRKHDVELAQYAIGKLSKIPGVVIFGPKDATKRGGVVSFNVGPVHAHDVASILDSAGIAVRSGNHCAEPLVDFLGVSSLARASFYIYNDKTDIDIFVEGIRNVKEVFKI